MIAAKVYIGGIALILSGLALTAYLSYEYFTGKKMIKPLCAYVGWLCAAYMIAMEM